MPDATGLELIATELREQLPQAKIDTHFQHGQATLIVDPASAIAAIKWLKEGPSLQFNFLASLHAADYLPKTPRFGVHYQLLNMERSERLGVKVLIDPPENPEELPALDSCTGLFPTANFPEREVYDMFGIKFKGHPDMTRILMPDGYQGWPQRRDFPVGGEPVQFTFNVEEHGQ